MGKEKVSKVFSKNNAELKQRLELQDSFANARHDEKKDLILLRQKYSLELITIRDDISCKRHKERIEILDKKFTYFKK